jgi:hypothetical protein
MAVLQKDEMQTFFHTQRSHKIASKLLSPNFGITLALKLYLAWLPAFIT